MALTLVNVTPEIENRLDALQPQSIEPVDLTLEDAFISYVGERGEKPFHERKGGEMKAMLWKELRENFKWAVLGMMALALAEFYGLMERSN